MGTTSWPSRGTRIGAIAIVVVVGLTAACGAESQESALTLAQNAVDKAEDDLEAAQQAADDAAAELCATSSDYITSIDRYGDLLTQTTTTVGDVRTGGTDLEGPSDDVRAAAAEVTSTQQDVVEAEEDLADAQEKLAEAQAEATDTTTSQPAAPETEEPSSGPTVPAATIDRVEQAESDFDAAIEGIDDRTSLRDASEEFNAAAVALESAWIQMFVQSGCLSDADQAEAAAAVAAYTTSLQQSLTDAGYDPGPVDGVYGPATVQAVMALQADSDLPETGTVDKATDAALRAKLEEADSAEAATTAALQQTLKLAGYWDGEVDGVWSDELTAAVEQVQTDLGIEATGEVDSQTVAAAQDAFEAAMSGEEETDEPSEPASEDASEGPSETQTENETDG